MSDTVQINITIPKEWKIRLERIARMYSVDEDVTLSHVDLIRRAIRDTYSLEDDQEQQE